MKITKISNATIDEAKKYAEHVFVENIYYRPDYPASLYDAICKWYRDNKYLPYEFRLCVLATVIARGIVVYQWGFQLPTNNEVRMWLPLVYKATKKRTPLKAVEADNFYSSEYRVVSLFENKSETHYASEMDENGNYDHPGDVYGIYNKCMELHQKWCDCHRYEECFLEKRCEECFILNGKEID